MSAYCHSVDRAAGVLWIAYEGRADELAANLRGYCVDFVPSLTFGRVGLTFRSRLNDDSLEVLKDAAVRAIELLTARRGVSDREEREFFTNIVIVQSCQSDGVPDSVQGQELAEWVRSPRKVVSDNGRAFGLEAAV